MKDKPILDSMTRLSKLIILFILFLTSCRISAQSTANTTLSQKQLNLLIHQALSSAHRHRRDSTTMFTYNELAIDYALQWDSVGKASSIHEPKDIAALRHRLQKPRTALLVDADYRLYHQSYAAARKALNLYLSSASSDIFKEMPTDTAAAAYMLSTIALNEKDYEKADYWSDLALADTRTAQAAAEVKAMIIEATMHTAEDSAAYAEVLTQLYQTNPESKRYFTWLMDFYGNDNQRANLEKFIDGQLEKHPDELMPWILKAELAMKSKRWNEAADTYKQITENGLETVPILYDLALCITNIAADSTADNSIPVMQRQVSSLARLKAAKEYLEKVRKMDPKCKTVDWNGLWTSVCNAIGKLERDNDNKQTTYNND